MRAREASAAPGPRPPPRRCRRAPRESPVTPSTTTSSSAPLRNATTGVPQACASAATIPNGSSHIAGHSDDGARAIASQIAVRGTLRESPRRDRCLAGRSARARIARRRRRRTRRSGVGGRAISIASAAPFSGLSLPANTAPSRRCQQANRPRRDERRQDRVDRDDAAPGARLDADTHRRSAGLARTQRRLAARRRRPAPGQVKGVHNRRAQPGLRA